MNKKQIIKKADRIFMIVTISLVLIYHNYGVPAILAQISTWWEQEFSKELPLILMIILGYGSIILLGMLLVSLYEPVQKRLIRKLDEK